jgi:uncharacterized integral membrane protein
VATTSMGGSGPETSGTSSTSGTSGTSGTSSTSKTSGRRRAAMKPRRRPTPRSAVVDISDDPVIEAAEKQPAAAPAAELQALDEDHLQKIKASQRARLIKAGILAGIGVLFIVFVLQNAKSVDVKLIFATISVPLIWVIVIPALIGAAACYVIARPEKDLHFHLPERRGRGVKASSSSE